MKRKYIAITLGITMSAALLTGCSSGSESDESAAEAGTVYGEITAIDGSSITINVGTLNTGDEDTDTSADSASGSDSSDSSSDTPADSDISSDSDSSSDDTDSSDTSTDADASAGDSSASSEESDSEADSAITSSENTDDTSTSDSSSDEESDSVQTSEGFPDGDSSGGDIPDGASAMSGIDSSMLELTGEELTITTDDDTTFTSQAFAMSGMDGAGMGGDAGSGNFADGEAPSGDSSDFDSSDAPEIPDGDSSADSADSESTEAPEIPDGDSSGGEAPSGDGSDMSSTDAPEIPDGDSPGGSAPSGDSANTDSSDSDSTDTEGSGSDSSDSDSSDTDSSDTAEGDSSSSSDDDTESSETSSDEEAADGFEIEETEISIDDLAVGDIISVTYDDDGDVASVVLLYDSDSSADTGSSGSEMTSTTDIDYTALLEITEDTALDGETYESTGTDENAIHVLNNAIASLTNMTITKYSADSTGGDNSSFYGVGAALLTTEGTTYISDSVIDTDSAGGAGIFSYGNGITYVSDTTITTAQDTSGGIHVAGGGTLYAWDLNVETQGDSSAAIRSDRGSGTMVVDGGTYTSNGTGSPAVYSTAEIAVNDAVLTANGSEAICIEGLNSIYLFDCDLTGNMADDSQNDTTWTVTLYQSQSGDSEEGNSTFQMVGGTLTSKNGGLFYTTNTESTFLLSGVDITASDDCEFFLMCTGNANERGWGSTGSNGADCSFTAISQEMEGDVIWDSISQLDFYITEGSSLTGAVIDDESYAGDGGSGYCSIYIDENSTWVVTGDSTVTNLYCEGAIVDENGDTVSITGTDGTVYVSGTGSYTITVETYSETADISGASSAADFSDYEVEKPSELE